MLRVFVVYIPQSNSRCEHSPPPPPPVISQLCPSSIPNHNKYRALIKAYVRWQNLKYEICGSIKVFINYVKKIKFQIPTKLLSFWVIPTLFTHLFPGQSAGRGTIFTGWRQSLCTVDRPTQATSSHTDGARCSPTRDTGLTGTLLDSLPSCSSVSVSFVSSPLSNHDSLQILCTVI